MAYLATSKRTLKNQYIRKLEDDLEDIEYDLEHYQLRIKGLNERGDELRQELQKLKDSNLVEVAISTSGGVLHAYDEERREIACGYMPRGKNTLLFDYLHSERITCRKCKVKVMENKLERKDEDE